MSVEDDVEGLLDRTGSRMVRLVGGPRAGEALAVIGPMVKVAELPPHSLPSLRSVHPANLPIRHGTYRQKAEHPDLFSWRGWDNESIADQCTAFADRVVPEYRDRRRNYSCGSHAAKRWQAAWDGACIALGGDPADYRR